VVEGRFAKTSRLVRSSMSNMFASIASGICALWGPLHGGANQAVLEMLEAIHQMLAGQISVSTKIAAKILSQFSGAPSRSSTSVSARRVVSAGMRNPSSVMPLLKSSSLTSGRTFKRIKSPAIVGVKFNRTPNSFHTIVMPRAPPEA